MEMYNDEYFKDLLNELLLNVDELNYQDLTSILLKDFYNIIQTKKHDGNLYISEDSKEVINKLLELSEEQSQELKLIVKYGNEQDLSYYQKEILKFQKIINVLKAMKRDILYYREQSSKEDSFSFIALPIKNGCSLDYSEFRDNTDIDSAIINLERMESLIKASTTDNGWIKTNKKGSGLHNVNGYLMYKNINSSAQRILFQQCRDNPKVICVLIIHSGVVHDNKDEENSRYSQYQALTKGLSNYLDTFEVNGKVTFNQASLNHLKDLYNGYKQKLALKLGNENNNIAFECLLDRLSLFAKEEDQSLKMDTEIAEETNEVENYTEENRRKL